MQQMIANPPEQARPGLNLIGTTVVARSLGLSVQTVLNRVACGTMDPMPAGYLSEPRRAIFRKCDLEAAVEKQRQADSEL